MTGYPPGPNTRGWRMDDEKATYPLYETLRKYGIRNICVHKGVPALFLAEYCHTDDVARAAADFPDLNFTAYHSAIPWEAELAEHGKRSKTKNLYAELGTTAFLIGQNPRRYARLVGTPLAGLGPNNILWVPTRRSSDRRRNGRSRRSRRSRSRKTSGSTTAIRLWTPTSNARSWTGTPQGSLVSTSNKHASPPKPTSFASRGATVTRPSTT